MKKQTIINELNKKGCVNFTIKDYDTNDYIDIKISKYPENKKTYNVYFSDSDDTYVKQYDQLISLIDYIEKTSDILNTF